MSQLAVKLFREKRHISYSQIRTYLACSLKYWFQYIGQLPRERQSIALTFGKAMHKAIEAQYLSLRDYGHPESLEVLREQFADQFSFLLADNTVPHVFKKEMPDADSALRMADQLLTVFHRQSSTQDPTKIHEVEWALTSPLKDEHGQDLEIDLVGIIDLALVREDGSLFLVDHKTAKSFSSLTADPMQFSTYGVLLEDLGEIDPDETLACRFDVLKKLKEPVMECYDTICTPEDRQRFRKLARAVLDGIQREVYIPNKGFLCGDCPFAAACQKW